MRKKLYSIFLAVFLCISLQGCGKNNNADKTDNDIPVDTTKSPESSQEEITSNPNVEETNNPGNEYVDEVKENIEPKSGHLSASQQYSDAYRVVKFLGLKEYKKLKGGNYTDKAKKNKKFLVLFLSIKNTSNEKDYINPNYITAKIDGKDIEHTFLVNEPFSYPTIFTNIEAGRAIGGFIVWEVPKNWKKLEMEYSAWKNIDGLTLSAKFTPDDLSDPLMYNAVNFN
ncbi:MAG: DUF4352 domain-containing protein [Lachnospiraceae bacterium]|nr:DUF4352 domain-containing protein [Lachnospiraceae bacterium]